MSHHKCVLIVIYNHKYDKNIGLIERIYQNRFSAIYHLVPFYTGNKHNVIPVYDNSRYFEGYIAQGFKHFYNEKFAHYFFVADDMILNPAINENNYCEYFHLDEKKSFIPEVISMYKDWYWSHTCEAIAFKPEKKGIEIKGELPDYEEAEYRLLNNGMLVRPLNEEKRLKWKHLNGKLRFNLLKKTTRSRFFEWLYCSVTRKRYALSYPLIGSYSDILIVSSSSVRSFCHYCGVFAALELFVEIAIPTALAFSTNEIVTENSLSVKGKALWKPSDYEFLQPYRKNLKLLMEKYPEALYIHPVKLSQWECSEV
ncbi:MAG: hypothetical protein LBH32_11355 [Dysgonamonadaceae bacterium]|jgi:hypothetical protein|nr:hypothetical protein [Dysgonamonadaceae bacterium]